MTAESQSLLETLDQKVDPRHAALVLVDVQNDFCAAGGFFDRAGYPLDHVRTAIPRLKMLLERARQAGIPVVFIQAIYDDKYLSDAMRERNQRRGLTIPRCLEGTWGAEFYEVKPLASEPVVVKHRYSAFAGTELNELLQRRGIRSLILTGVSTDTCVESTARDGYFLDYYITIASDCCGAITEQDHEGTLARCERDFGLVASSEEIIQAWERVGAAAPQALPVVRRTDT